MAQGTLRTFEEFRRDLGLGVHNLNTDTFKISLHSVIPLVSAANPSYGDWTEVAGGNGYTTGGETLVTSYSEAAGTGNFVTDGSIITWTKNLSGPTDIRAAVIYNSTSVGDEAVAFVDMTDDGSTPISLQDGDITWDAEATLNRICAIS